MKTLAVVFEQPERVALRSFPLPDPGPEDVVVATEWAGVSTGTERLLWSGRMPPFPGLGYPLVPGYEAVGRILVAGPQSGRRPGERVFVPGARCYGETRALFGGTASRLQVPGSRTLPLGDTVGQDGVLLALAATALHAIRPGLGQLPELIVGHGALGRLLARLVLVAGGSPVVWETDPVRQAGARGYPVIAPEDDPRHDYAVICDATGDSALLDSLIARLAHGGELVLAGFYPDAVRFAFPPAFLKEARIRIAAEWRPEDLREVTAQARDGRLDLGGIVTHQVDADRATAAYATAFGDRGCVKLVLDWRNH